MGFLRHVYQEVNYLINIHSENPRHQEFKVKRDTKRTSKSQVTELLKGLVYGTLKRNLHVQTTEKPTVKAVLKNLLTGKSSSLNINVGRLFYIIILWIYICLL